MTPVLYLHGFASGPSSSKAQYFREHLARAGFEVSIPDLAAGDFERLTVTGQLAVIEQHITGAPPHLIGSSMGGYLAALYAARHPEVHRLVLLAPAFGFVRRWPERLGAAGMEAWRRTGSIEVFHYGERRDCRLSYALFEDAALYEDFPDFDQPALVFHGAHDDVAPAELSRAFAEGRANVHLEIVDSGHDLLNVLDDMLPKVTAFLAEAG
jgi:pimeloyl-ACP methyl ester carboxylesterase